MRDGSLSIEFHPSGSRLRGQKVGHPRPRAHGPLRERAKERAHRLATELPGARLDRGVVERAG